VLEVIHPVEKRTRQSFFGLAPACLCLGEEAISWVGILRRKSAIAIVLERRKPEEGETVVNRLRIGYDESLCSGEITTPVKHGPGAPLKQASKGSIHQLRIWQQEGAFKGGALLVSSASDRAKELRSYLHLDHLRGGSELGQHAVCQFWLPSSNQLMSLRERRPLILGWKGRLYRRERKPSRSSTLGGKIQPGLLDDGNRLIVGGRGRERDQNQAMIPLGHLDGRLR
jgi:hypothetical protein